MRKSVMFATAVAAAAVLSGVRVYADDAADIEAFYSNNSYVQYDNTAGLDPNGYPVITVIASMPGTTSGHLYTGWSALVQHQSGSLDLFVSSATLTTLNHQAGYNLAAGDGVNSAGQWSPFDQIPELAFSTVAASNNYLTVQSTGNALPTPPQFTVNQIAVSDVSNHYEFAGFYMEIQNATISDTQTGANASVFPTYAQAATYTETYSVSDGTGTMELFDWVTSYSKCGAMGGTAVPTGPVDIYGFVDAFSGSPEFVPLAIVPEPSAFVLAGMGLLGLLAIRRRRS